MLRSFLLMLWCPAAAVDRLIATGRLGWGRLTVYVAIMGLLRGLIEETWILLMAGQFEAMALKGHLLSWYFMQSGSFLVANMMTGLFRWGLFAMVPYALGRFVGGQGRWTDYLRVFGVAMGIYVITILPNYAYLSWDLPALRFEVAPAYNPLFGLGQVLTSLWLAWFGYVTARRLHALPRFESAMLGIAVPAANVGLFVIASQVWFNLKPLLNIASVDLFSVSTMAFITAALVATPVLFWIGSRFARSERQACRHTEEADA